MSYTLWCFVIPFLKPWGALLSHFLNLVPTGLPNIFGAKGAGNFCLHNKNPWLVDPPPCRQRSQCKVNPKQ